MEAENLGIVHIWNKSINKCIVHRHCRALCLGQSKAQDESNLNPMPLISLSSRALLILYKYMGLLPNSIFSYSLLHPRLVPQVLTTELYPFQQTCYPSCAKCVINGTAVTAASVVVGTQKQCGSSAAKQRMLVRDEYLARIHVLFSVSPRLLQWVFVVPVLVGLC